MEKWTTQYRVLSVESFITNESVISVQRSFRQLFGRLLIEKEQGNSVSQLVLFCPVC